MDFATIVLLAAALAQSTAATPLSSPANWISTADYPASALRASEEGGVGFALEIGPDGRVRSCTITASSGSPTLDQTTCSLITLRARFAPTGTAAPTPMTYRSRVMCKIPRNLPQPVARSLVSSFVVETDGRMTNCAYENAMNVEPEVLSQPTPCETNARTTPFLDAVGKPVRRRIRILRSVEIDDLP